MHDCDLLIKKLSEYDIDFNIVNKDDSYLIELSNGLISLHYDIYSFYELIDNYTVDDLVSLIVEGFDDVMDNQYVFYSLSESFEKSSNNIIPYFINTEKNQEFLESVFHVECFDISLCFKIILNIEDSFMEMDITEDLLNNWGISGKEFMKKINVFNEYNKPQFFLNNNTTALDYFPNISEGDICCVTNSIFSFASGLMFNKAFLSYVYNIIGSFFILPITTDFFVILKNNRDLLPKLYYLFKDDYANGDFVSNSVYEYTSENNLKFVVNYLQL